MFVANVLQPLIDAEEWTLEALHALGLGWGLAIIFLTVLVRAAIVPLTVRQYRAQRRMAEHMPEIKRLRERHQGDTDRAGRETLAYYREHRVNPLGAFLPLLLQAPVFISLYYLMRKDVRSGLFEHAGFLFIPDLSAQAHGVVLALLVLGYAGSQLASGLVATRTLEGSPRKVTLLLPLLFVGVATRFPAGLLVYWITSSLWGLGQQLVLSRARARALLPVAPTAPLEAAPGTAHVRANPHPRSKKKPRSRRRR